MGVIGWMPGEVVLASCICCCYLVVFVCLARS